VAIRTPIDPEARRAYHRELRNVARLLRWTGIALVLIGTTGIALGRTGAWFVPPSWISFLLGWALALCGIVRRERSSPVGGAK
jgi:hypothetical protein